MEIKKTPLIFIILFCLFSTISAFAIDYSNYDLKDFQIELLKKLEARGFSEEKLNNFASIFERNNNKVEQLEYIPPHTQQELEDTEKWAAGGAFYMFAEAAGVSFDRAVYIKDCPNWAIFGFLKASGREHVNYDIMKTYINTRFELDYLYKKDPEAFKENYLKLAAKRGFLQYITCKQRPLNEVNIPILNH